jgi:hypothetical protein
MSNKTALAAVKHIDSRILFLRGQKIILDSDLAALYGVEVKHLNQQIKRNRKRFPSDFLFRVSAREFEILRSQIVTSSDQQMAQGPGAKSAYCGKAGGT